LLETGPDEEMGLFGRVAPDASADYVPVMRFEPAAATPFVKELPSHLIDPLSVSQDGAVGHRQFVLNSGLCANRRDVSARADMASLIGINGKPFDMKRIDVEAKLGTSEVWEITSIGMAHPFHVHGALFRVLSIEGSRCHRISPVGKTRCL
jgi:FtsP/CotA-like multicopper oxidase with cupredoxin domain